MSDEAERLGVGQELLRKCRVFAVRYTADDVDALIDDAAAHGFDLSFLFVVRLLRLARPQRKQVQTQMIRGGWSIRRLDLQIFKLKETHRVGRAKKVPATVDEALWEILGLCRQWEQLMRALGATPGGSTASMGPRVGAGLSRRLRAADKALGTLAATAEKKLKRKTSG